MTFPIGRKSEWQAQAERIVRESKQGNLVDAGELLAWLRDMNWPGARVIAAHLRGREAETLHGVREVLRSNDSMWAYWVLAEFKVAFSRAYWSELAPELLALAAQPDADEVHIQALEVLARHALVAGDRLRALIDAARSTSGVPEAEYAHLLEQ